MGQEAELALKALLGQGLLGILLFLALFVIWKLGLHIRDLQEKRIAEGLAQQKVLIELTQALKDLTNGIRERGVR